MNRLVGTFEKFQGCGTVLSLDNTVAQLTQQLDRISPHIVVVLNDKDRFKLGPGAGPTLVSRPFFDI